MPIHYRRTCPECGENVSRSDIVKGCEYETGRFAAFERAEPEKLPNEASSGRNTAAGERKPKLARRAGS